MRRAERALALGPVGLLLADPSVTEVMINGPGPVLVDRGGRPEPTGYEMTAADVEVLIERMLDPLGLQVDRTRPYVDARLPDGSRVNVVVPPAAVAGPIVTIRRFSVRPLGLDAFGDQSMVELLQRLVAERRTMLVVGGTSSGKTSLLNALAAFFEPDERIVTIEDTAELRFPGNHIVSLEAREPNREGSGAIEMGELVRNALRMRPDRLVVGEVRGAEALDLLLALNTGHSGSMATCHANSALSALDRMAVLARLGGRDLPNDAVHGLITGAFDVVICVGRNGSRRMVTEVVEFGGSQRRASTLWSATPRAVA